MKKIVIIVFTITLLTGCSYKQQNEIEICIDKERILNEFISFTKNNPSNKLKYECRINYTSTYSLQNIRKPLMVCDLDIVNKADGYITCHRVIIGTSNKGIFETIIYDSGFIIGDCGTYDIRINNITSLFIKRPLLVIEKQYIMNACMDVPDIQIDSVSFHDPGNLFRCVLNLETNYINYNNPEHGIPKDPEIRTMSYYPTAGDGASHYSFLATLIFNPNNKPNRRFITYTWDKDITNLIPLDRNK